MKLHLHNQQTRISLKTASLRKLIRSLASRIADDLGLAPWSELSVVFTDDRGMVPVNTACFGKAEPTDVISQSYDPHPGGAAGPGGEVLVNVERALSVGGAGKRGKVELALYITHGLHHLAGAADDTPAQRRRMLRREHAWLSAAAREGLVENLWRAARCRRQT